MIKYRGRIIRLEIYHLKNNFCSSIDFSAIIQNNRWIDGAYFAIFLQDEKNPLCTRYGG